MKASVLDFAFRFATARARDIFLTTYYDPFYPDLHLYITKPDALRHSVVSSLARAPSWSLHSLRETLRRHGWNVVVKEILDRLLLVVSDWQRQAWEAWGFEDQLLKISWPPT
jgi:serine/arginine repetitive matrix protein 2